ncbi:MAG: DUF4422 domain-containing protein [Muribaculum sp.]|nr:DUF4422 domain-containing protein [Muribaculum sp.]
MDRRDLGRLTVYRMSEDEWNDAELRNRCFMQTETAYIAYVREHAVADEALFADLSEASGSFVRVYCRGVQTEFLQYAEVFGLIGIPVEAMVFAKALVRDCGAFHPGLPALIDLEFLCRLARQTGGSMLEGLAEEAEGVEADGGESIGRRDVADAETAYACAYLMRLHAPDLGEMADPVFRLLSDTMAEWGIGNAFAAGMQFLLSDEEAFERLARQTAPFIVLRGDDTCGGVLQNFADDLCDALADHGQAVIEMGEGFMQHERLYHMICKGVVGFQSKALEIDFFRQIRGPKFQFWFDNPLHFEGVLRSLPEEYYILCQDAGYAASIREYYQTPHAIQFPPGGRMPRKAAQRTSDEGCAGQYAAHRLCSEERPYELVFVGSCFEDAVGELSGVEREFYDYMLEHPCETFEEGAWELLRRRGEEPDKQEFARFNYSLKAACRAVIGHFRNLAVSTILQAGFQVEVYGESWKRYAGGGRENLRIHPQATVEESLQELSKAKVGLNIMSWHKAGMTERIANIMLSGAVCLTEETAYVREHLCQCGEDAEVVCFRLDKLEKLPKIVGGLLEDGERRERIAERGYRRAMAEYTWAKRAEELIDLSGQAAENALTVFVATHVKCSPPAGQIYVPLHVGREGQADLGYLGDNTGENISELNMLYGELTGLFWIWQNVRDLDYVGLCHYRRYFINERQEAMEKREYLKLLEQYDAVVPRHARCQGSYYRQFGLSHNVRDLDAVGHALKRLYPAYAAAYDQAMEGEICYWGNLVVTSLPILRAYAEWLFEILAEASGEIDVAGYDDYHRRVFGFLSEQMFYVFALANGLSCYEAAVGVSEEKAETKALRERLEVLVGEQKEREAGELLAAQLRLRPDLLLPESDVTGELQELARKLLK